MEEKEVEKEAQDELDKGAYELIKDIIREANTLPDESKAAGEKQNLDLIKHLVKRLAVHQITLEEKTKVTNYLLILLAFISAVGAISSILNFLANEYSIHIVLGVDLLFIILGLFGSLFYGLSSYRVFTYPHKDRVYRDNPEIKKFDVTKRARFHEFWTHFICSVAGWICLYVLYSDLARAGLDQINIKEIAPNHLFILLVGLLGVVGFLPLTLWGIANAVQFLAREAVGLITRIAGQK